MQHEFSNLFGVKIKTLNISNTETLICIKTNYLSEYSKQNGMQ